MIHPRSPEGTGDDRDRRIRQLVNECVRRRAAGESMTDRSLMEAHSDLMPELGQELRNLNLIQQAEQQAQHQADRSVTVDHPALQIRCPHCNQPVELVDDSSLSDVVCPSCGSHFGLVDSPQSFQAAELESVGHFKLLDKLGVGAFGSVWSARDTELDRIVAIKIPRKGQISPADTEQFIREARATAQLNHPSIVRVYEVGREGDRVYIVTDWVQGVDLAEWLTSQHATPREAAELCAKLADALHHAHERGVIHRDLKPSNIMLDTQGEPHLMDFGLAKREAGEITMTVDGKLLGTPAYMSPEQARGAAHDADRRSDVYSLGVILFELLTGERPFRGSTRMLLHQVLVEDAPSPRRLNGGIPKDLETICLKCLEKDPLRRYQTAGQLADDLRRFLRGEPVRARRISRTARALRWCRRNPVGAGFLGLLAILAIVGPLVGMNQLRLRRQEAAARQNAVDAQLRAERSQQQAERTAEEKANLAKREANARRDLEQEAEKNRRLLYIADMAGAWDAWERNDIPAVEKLLRRQQPRPGQQDLRGFEWRYLWQLIQFAMKTRTFQLHGTVTADLLFSDGSEVLSALSNRGVWRWRISTMQLLDSCEQDPAGIWLDCCRFSSDGKLAAFGYEDGRVSIVNLETHKAEPLAGHDATVCALAISPDGKYAATGDVDGIMKLWSLSTRDQLATIQAHTRGVLAIEFSPDAASMISGGGDQTVKLWSIAQSGTPLRTFDLSPYCENPSSARSVAVSRDGKTLAVGTNGDAVVMLWNIEGNRPIHTLKGHQSVVWALAFSPDGKRLASGGYDGRIRLWDVETGTLAASIKADYFVVSLRFSDDGSQLASGGGSTGYVKLWDLRNLPGENIFRGHTDNVECLAISSDSRLLASASVNGELKLWPLSPPTAPLDVIDETRQIESIDFSPDGRVLASTQDNLVKLWDVATSRLLRALPHEGYVRCVRFSPNGTLLAAGGAASSPSKYRSGAVVLWDMRTFQPVGTMPGHGDQVGSLAFSPDGQTLATGCGGGRPSIAYDTAVRIWDVTSRQLRTTLRTHTGGVATIAFSPDGTMLAAGGYGVDVGLWNTSDWKPIPGFREELFVNSLAFTADNRRLITASNAMTVHCRDVATGQLWFRFHGHQGPVGSMVLSRDGSILATGSFDNTIRLWRAATPEEVKAAGW